MATTDSPQMTGPSGDGETATTVEQLIQEMIESRTAELEAEIDRLGDEIEEVENFARISLNERKIGGIEANLTEFSDSMTGFAERAFNDINQLEERMDLQAVVLAAVLDALREEGIDVDTAAAERQQEASVVASVTPEERLAQAIEES